MKLKILSIDFNLREGDIINSSFYTANSFSDYDVIIIDPVNISKKWENVVSPRGDGSLWCYADHDGGFSKGLKTFMQRRSEELELLLEKTGGLIICFLRPRGIILNYQDDRHYSYEIRSYSWLPSRKFNYTYERRTPYTNKLETVEGELSFSGYYFEPSPRTGKEIGEINKTHPFSQYFTVFKNEIEYETIIDEKSDIVKIGKVLAKNKVSEVISLEIPFGTGKLIFLPPLNQTVTPEKIKGVLIDCIKKSLNWTQSLVKPLWINKYELTGETELNKEIDDLQSKIIGLEKEKQKIEESKNKLEMLKSMIYEQGKYGLEPPVREAFRILGFNVLDEKKYEEVYDLYIKEKDLEIIGEIEGSNGQIDIQKYRQLIDYVDVEVRKEKQVKGILIGNAFINIEPEQRKEQFTRECIIGCKRQKFCRITTYELFKAVHDVLLKPDDKKLKESIKLKILECEDEFKFDF